MMHELLERKLMNFERLALRYFGRAGKEGLCSLNLVTTNGCFDVLHVGHVTYLEEARALGSHLIVLLNSDDSVRRLKGLFRPYNKVEHRALVLAALESVSGIVVFDEDTPVEILERMYMVGVGPHFHVKAGDYKAEDLPEAEVVQHFGGKVHIAELLEGFSTTALAHRIRQTAAVQANGIGGVW